MHIFSPLVEQDSGMEESPGSSQNRSIPDRIDPPRVDSPLKNPKTPHFRLDQPNSVGSELDRSSQTGIDRSRLDSVDPAVFSSNLNLRRRIDPYRVESIDPVSIRPDKGRSRSIRGRSPLFRPLPTRGHQKMQEGRKVLPLPPQLGLPPPPPPPASSTAAGVLPSRPPPPPLLLLVLVLLLLLPLLLPLLLFLLNPIFSFKFKRGLASMADEGHEEEQPQVDIGWKHGVLIDAASKRVRCNHCGKEMNGGVYRLKQHIAGIGTNVVKCKHCPRELVNEMKEYMAGRQQQRGIRIQHQQKLHKEISGKGKSKAATRTVDVEDSDDTDYEDLSPNEREWREGLRQSRRAAMLESDMRRFHSTREGSSSGASVTRPPAPPIRRGGSMRGTGPTSGVDTILGRKSSSKQPGIKHAMKGVKATAASAKHAVKNIVLRMVDGEDKNDMGYLYEAMDKAKERLREKHPQAYKKWWKIIDARWYYKFCIIEVSFIGQSASTSADADQG
ncbi:hypothetical protein Taro_012738 [Colocasia esculenta]|uniref:BED-type domain-containing protein n=1 Tax=Colocasia esculenta TaxID=4460 RepID=A0A843UEF1_COLES|nr:hypothetical protein [Colocasia esculenta]